MKRPVLNEISLDGIMQSFLTGKPGPCIVITMSRGQWDKLLEVAYNDGRILLELDENEIPIKAYRRLAS